MNKAQTTSDHTRHWLAAAILHVHSTRRTQVFGRLRAHSDGGHHAIVFMFKDVTVIHERAALNRRVVERNDDFDLQG